MNKTESNPYVKPLKPFDPKKDLNVNESFKASGLHSREDTLSDLESDEMDVEVSGDAGKESHRFKTGAPIRGGILKFEIDSRTYLLVGNKLGEVYILTPDHDKLKAASKFKVHGTINRKPAYADGIVYIATREGLVYAIDPGLRADSDKKSSSKLKVIWQKKMNKGILSEPIATGKILIIATLGGLHAYEAYYQDESQQTIGKSIWTNPMAGVASSPRIHSGLIYVGTEDNQLIAFDYGGSKISPVWSYKANDSIRSKPCVSRKGNLILAASVDGSVYCLNNAGGSLRWIYIVKAPVFGSISAGSIDGKEHFYFGADNGVFYCINSFGKMVWEFKTKSKIRTEPLVHGSTVYFGAEDNTFYALSARTGNLIFKFPTDGNINGMPVIVGDTIFFGSTDSFVHGVQI